MEATRWQLCDGEFRENEYKETWLSREKAELYETEVVKRVRILEIYKDCFFAASTESPSPYMIKVNAELSADWHTGDIVSLEYDALYYDDALRRAEVDATAVSAQ